MQNRKYSEMQGFEPVSPGGAMAKGMVAIDHGALPNVFLTFS
jgi:hypothetical protein